MLLDTALRADVRGRLAAFDRRDAPGDVGTGAAVALALVGEPDGTAGLVLLQRGQVGSHRGQFGLPGGRIDAGEDVVGAALRELEEEVGVRTGRDDVLGRLDAFVTRSGFAMHPVVVWCAGQRPRIASPQEVADVHVVDLADLAAEDAVRHTTIDASGRPSVQVDVGFTTVFAPTGAILHQFRAVCLRGEDVRVDDLDSPRFTWR